MPRKSAIGTVAGGTTKAQFAEELSSLTSFTANELKELFPKKVDREELLELIDIVQSSADDNKKKAELISKISKVSGAVLKIAKKVVV